MHPNEAPPRPSGLRALRGVVSGTNHHLGSLAGLLYIGRGLESAVVKAGADVVYFYVSLRDDLVASVPRDPGSMLRRAFELLDAGFSAVAGPARANDMRVDDLFDRDPLPYWGTHQVTLLGDAAHPLLPHTGQGAAQALEDAVALGRVLAHERHIPDALRHYERVRAKRTTDFAVPGPPLRRGHADHQPVAVLGARYSDSTRAALDGGVVVRDGTEDGPV